MNYQFLIAQEIERAGYRIIDLSDGLFKRGRVKLEYMKQAGFADVGVVAKFSFFTDDAEDGENTQ